MELLFLVNEDSYSNETCKYHFRCSIFSLCFRKLNLQLKNKLLLSCVFCTSATHLSLSDSTGLTSGKPSTSKKLSLKTYDLITFYYSFKWWWDSYMYGVYGRWVFWFNHETERSSAWESLEEGYLCGKQFIFKTSFFQFLVLTFFPLL